mgnify:CR=1 FL=1
MLHYRTLQSLPPTKQKISRDLQICSAKHFLLSVRNLHNKYKVQISIGMYTFSFKQFLQISLLLLRF